MIVEPRKADTEIPSRTKILGWSVIGLIGGGATVAALVIFALLIVLADIFVLEKTLAQTSYHTIVRQ